MGQFKITTLGVFVPGNSTTCVVRRSDGIVDANAWIVSKMG
jgi:hypothetical protein